MRIECAGGAGGLRVRGQHIALTDLLGSGWDAPFIRSGDLIGSTRADRAARANRPADRPA